RDVHQRRLPECGDRGRLAADGGRLAGDPDPGQIARVDREQRDHPRGIDGGRGRPRRRRRGGHARRARPRRGRRGAGARGRRRADEGALTMSATGLVLVLVTAALTMAANLLLRVGIIAAGGFSFGGLAETVRGLVALFTEPRFLLGFVLYFVASVVWFRVVATERLSVAYPLLVSCTFTLVTAGAV